MKTKCGAAPKLACREENRACFNDGALHWRSAVLRNIHIWAPVVVLATLANGCIGTSTSPMARTEAPHGHVEETTVARTVVTPREALSVNDLFDRGMRRFAEQQYALAAIDLETAAQAGPDQPWAVLAYYQAGLARDETGEFSASAENFKRAVYGPASLPQQHDAHVRLVRVLVHLERWSEAGHEADGLLHQGKGLRPIEEIVARGARAMAELEHGDLGAAERDIESARSLVEDQQFQLPVKIHRDIAVVYFALGELRRRRADAIQFVPPTADFSEKLEQRCQLLLDAQSAFSNSMRAYDAHWSVMAGYSVGQLYARLHADLMELLGALSFDEPERGRLFEAALRLRYSVLLSKAVSLMDHTLTVAARTKDDSTWVRLTRESYQRLNDSLTREQSALALVPYTRDQMNAALQNLREVHRTNASSDRVPRHH